MSYYIYFEGHGFYTEEMMSLTGYDLFVFYTLIYPEALIAVCDVTTGVILYDNFGEI